MVKTIKNILNLQSLKIREKLWPVRLGVRTSDFHSENRGSIPLRAAKEYKLIIKQNGKSQIIGKAYQTR